MTDTFMLPLGLLVFQTASSWSRGFFKGDVMKTVLALVGSKLFEINFEEKIGISVNEICDVTEAQPSVPDNKIE